MDEYTVVLCIHVPTLVEMACDRVTPLVMQYGLKMTRQRHVPYALYLRCIENNLEQNNTSLTSCMSSIQLYRKLLKSRRVTVKTLKTSSYFTHQYDDFTPYLMIILGHIDLDDAQSRTAVPRLFGDVVRGQAYLDERLEFIRFLFEERFITCGFEWKMGVLNSGLRSCPVQPTRELLLKYGARLDPEEIEYLYYAAANGMIDLVKSAVESGYDVNKPSPVHGTLLNAAAQSGSLTLVQYLIEHGAVPKSGRARFDPALIALSYNHLHICEFFFSNKMMDLSNVPDRWWNEVSTHASVDWVISHGISTTDAAVGMIRRDQYPALRHLVEDYGVPIHRNILVNIDLSRYPGIYFIDFLVCSGMLMSSDNDDLGADAAVSDMGDMSTCIHMAPLYARYFIDHGCDIDAVNHAGRTALSMACEFKHDAVSTLLMVGARVDIPCKYGRTVMNIAMNYAHRSSIDIVSMIRNASAHKK